MPLTHIQIKSQLLLDCCCIAVRFCFALSRRFPDKPRLGLPTWTPYGIHLFKIASKPVARNVMEGGYTQRDFIYPTNLAEPQGKN